ncbi:nucleoside hydrolase [Evansella sp. AB-P1]|uniref:nucleoside hydrolase n=1 Tax=Evansella sp. AB-P1 TaxID=3037653 RepID=UPI00241C5B08|nr:nucleoside hydrolase [Evansella sp. AB-P1]MDG5789279.1 nucleoside hydrolase [Evansella sp. AB-P1]
MKNVILDVDTGIDDALGIILAIKSKKLNVLGITTTSGNVSLDKATINTKKVLSLLKKDKEISVHRGASKPLARESIYEHNVHGIDGLGGALTNIQVKEDTHREYAPDFIIKTILNNKHHVSLVMTAPLTNLALAMKKEPEIIQYVDEVIVMGGVVKQYGNITPVAEYNMYVDPEAAKAVFHSGLPITLVTLDVTRQALLREKHINQIEDKDIHEFVQTSTSHYIDRYYKRNGVKACALHDPLAVAVAIDHGLIETEKYYIDIETKSEICDGQTVCDFQNRLNKEPNIHVSVKVDHERFMDMFIDTLNQN